MRLRPALPRARRRGASAPKALAPSTAPEWRGPEAKRASLLRPEQHVVQLRIVIRQQRARENGRREAERKGPFFHAVGGHAPEPVLHLRHEGVVLEPEPGREIDLRQPGLRPKFLQPRARSLAEALRLRRGAREMHWRRHCRTP